jgi:hypothetical protein
VKTREDFEMALLILLPDDLNDREDAVIKSALHGAGADHISGRVWRFSGGIVAPEKFRTEIKDRLPAESRNTADTLGISVSRTNLR